MLKIIAIGNLTNDIELKTNSTTGKPYALLRIADDRTLTDTDSEGVVTKVLNSLKEKINATLR